MKHVVVVAMVLAFLAPTRDAAAGNSVPAGDYFFGYWHWRPNDHAQGSSNDDWYYSARVACTVEMQRLSMDGQERTYTGIRRVPSNDALRPYVCTFKFSDGTQGTSDSITSAYACPANATPLTLAPHTAADWRCRCDSGTCAAQVPPAPDRGERCEPPKAPGALTLKDAAKLSADNRANRFLLLSEYNTVKKDLAATEGCDFQPGDFYGGGPDAKSDLNIGFLCGYRKGDEAAANKIAGLGSTPSGYTWHHHLDLGRMQLVKTAAHQARCGSHSGGVAVWKEAFGLQDYPFFLPPVGP